MQMWSLWFFIYILLILTQTRQSIKCCLKLFIRRMFVPLHLISPSFPSPALQHCPYYFNFQPKFLLLQTLGLVLNLLDIPHCARVPSQLYRHGKREKSNYDDRTRTEKRTRGKKKTNPRWFSGTSFTLLRVLQYFPLFLYASFPCFHFYMPFLLWTQTRTPRYPQFLLHLPFCLELVSLVHPLLVENSEEVIIKLLQLNIFLCCPFILLSDLIWGILKISGF